MQVRVVAFAALVALLFVLLGGRLWYLQILTGEDYSLSAQQTSTREDKIPARRGVISTRDGEVLANNTPGLNVTVVPEAISNEQLKKLTQILGANSEKVLNRYETAKSSGDSYNPVLVKENASESDVVYVSERTEQFPGVSINDDYVRNYPEKGLAAHVLGYTGAITGKELEQQRFEGLPNDAVVGKSGLEYSYGQALRGEPGKKVYNVDVQGRVVDGNQRPIAGNEVVQRPERVEEPVSGNDLVTTVNMDLQKKAESELDEAISRAQSKGFAGTGGAVVAMNPENGQILAMASRPDFNPELFVGGVNGSEEVERYNYLTSEESDSALTNRAIFSSFPAASTFKVFTGMAGLAYNAITPYTTYTDTGECWRPRGVDYGCWQSWREYRDTGTTHGTQNYLEAIADSNNKYFYQVADWLWNKTSDENLLPKFYEKFGFGEETGIDLPGESAGRVPTEQWQKRVGDTPEDRFWSVGRWVNMAIGQGGMLATPTQLVRGYSAIYNGGTLVTPHLGLRIETPDGKTVREISPEPSKRLDLTQRQLQSTRTGLEMVTGPDGTASSQFENSPLSVLGKTGTAQTGSGEGVAWFVGWAENQDEPVVVLTMVEGSGKSEQVAAPAVRDILESYHGADKKPPQQPDEGEPQQPDEVLTQQVAAERRSG